MYRHWTALLGALILVVAWSSGCKKDDRGEGTDGDADGDVAADGDADGDGDMSGDADEGEGDADPIDPCSREGRRADTLENGTAVLDGITLEESTPIGDIIADRAAFDGEWVQIEGVVTRICSSAGCWVELEDMTDGSRLILKVPDGMLDFRTVAEVGGYAIGEGYYAASGHPSERVDIGGAIFRGPTCSE